MAPLSGRRQILTNSTMSGKCHSFFANIFLTFYRKTVRVLARRPYYFQWFLGIYFPERLVMSEIVKAHLENFVWKEGFVVPVAYGPYRHRVVVHCTIDGRQKAMFVNGEKPYAGYIELLSPSGQWIEAGSGVVPVLSDGRMLMVVEKRPAQGRYEDRPMLARIGGKEKDLRVLFGPNADMEFPGGAANPNEGLKFAGLRELVEETGIQEQTALYYGRRWPLYPFGSDICISQHLGVAFLSGMSFQDRVEDDGGLNVFALTEEEVQENIWRGVICAGQAALLQWAFYQEVKKARADAAFQEKLVSKGYLSIEEMKVANVK